MGIDLFCFVLCVCSSSYKYFVWNFLFKCIDGSEFLIISGFALSDLRIVILVFSFPVFIEGFLVSHVLFGLHFRASKFFVFLDSSLDFVY